MTIAELDSYRSHVPSNAICGYLAWYEVRDASVPYATVLNALTKIGMKDPLALLTAFEETLKDLDSAHALMRSVIVEGGFPDATE